jgi:hypothetical protein
MKHAKKNGTFTSATIALLLLFQSACRNNETLERGIQIRHVFLKHTRAGSFKRRSAEMTGKFKKKNPLAVLNRT